MHSCAHETAASRATTAATLAARGCPFGVRLSPGRVPDHGGGLLCRRQHPRAAVLDGLELPGWPAELMADLRIVSGGPGGPAGDAGCRGAEQDGGQAGDRAAVEAGEQPVRGQRDAVRTDPRDGAGEVEAV